MKNIAFIFSFILCFSAGYYMGFKNHSPAPINISSNTLDKSKTPVTTASLAPASPIDVASCNCEYTEELSIIKNQDNATTSLPSIFSQLLESGQYSEAINLYHTVWNISVENANSLKQQFIQHLQLLLESPTHNRDRITNAIDSYLTDFYDDIDILLILADFYYRTELCYEALNTFQLIDSYALNQSDKNRLNKSYKNFMSLVNEALTNTERLDELINIYTFADNTGLLSEEDRYQLIEIYLQSDNEYQAKAEAEILNDNIAWTEKVSTLFKEYGINTKNQDNHSTENSKFESSIALIKKDNQFIVPVRLSGSEANLLLDTGASITTISKDFFQTIKSSTNMTYQSTQHFLTANGKTTGEIYLLDSLTLGDYDIKNISIAVLDYPTSSSSVGLLGMNVLQQFVFEIDQKNAFINLRQQSN